MARSFNGTSDYVAVDDAVTHVSWFNDPSGRAYAGWIKAPAGQSNVGIYSEGNSANNTNFWFLSIAQASPATNKLRWNGAGTPTSVTNAVIADSTWHHIALTIDRVSANTSNSYFIYVDGVLDQTAVMSSTVSGSGAVNQATLGALRRTTAGSFLHGLLAHWGIWNRPLTAEEVRMLARGGPPSRFGPMHYYPLSEPESVARDKGRVGAHGHFAGTVRDAPMLAGLRQ